ncbi:MAG: MMPL family transporter [Thermoleophilia bacterium]
MAAFLHRLGLWVARHPLPVILGWVAVIVLMVLLVARIGALTTNDLTLPGTDSQRATDLLAAKFPPQQNGKSPIVFHAESGKIDTDARKNAIAKAAKALQAHPDVVSAPNPFGQNNAAQIAKDDTTAFIPVLLDINSADLTTEEAQEILDLAEVPVRGTGLEVAAGGSIGSELSKPETESSELVGIIAAMIILSFAFGTAVAMGIPIVTALAGLIVGLTGIGLMGHVVGIPDIAPTLATMIGLGVGIDYSLFLVNRHRRQLAEGMEMKESIALTVATSGGAVAFAGGTVVIALVALAVAGIPLVTSLGYASAVAVLTAVLAAITLLPAVLALLGARINRLRLPTWLRPPTKPAGTGMWAAWGRTVTRHPFMAIAASVVALGILAIPVLSLNLGQEDIGATPTDTTERQAYDLMTEGYGVGYNGPLLISVALDTPATTDPAVQKQLDQANALQAELEQEQKEGQAQQAALEQQAAALQAQQAQLEQQQAALLAQQADLERQAAALRAQRASAEAQLARIERQIAQIEGRRTDLLQRAETFLTKARQAASTGRAAEQRLQQVLAAIQAARAQLPGIADPADRQRVQDRIDALEQQAATLRQQIQAARADERAQKAQAATLRRQAAQQRRANPTVVNEARSLAQQVRTMAAEAARLDAQKRSLEAQAAELKRQAASLQAQAADLQAQKADLEALQAQAEAQQKQAEALKKQLTATLTKAGGDSRGTDPRLVKLQDALTDTPGIAVLSPPEINTAGDAAIFTAVPTTAPAATETADLVKTVRSTVIPEATAGSDIHAYVGGSTAANVDLAAKISSRLALVIATVLGLSFLVLLVAFRSLLVPLQAAVTNLLCVGAAFGVLTAAFQWGWGIGIFGVETTRDTVPIASYVPLMMFAVLFGLSMDYQVFLLSQISEHRRSGKDERAAVASGMAASAPVIVAAALIMIGVFGSFVLNGDPTVKQFGVGLATAVFLAAAMVLVLAPALLVSMGRGTWWLPSWLARIVPEVDIEGRGLEEKRRAEEVAEAKRPFPEPEPAAPAD